MKDSYEIKMTQFLKHAYIEVEKHANQLVINKNIPQHSFAGALSSRICELAGSCIILIDYKVTIGIPILVRGILEAYVDLINLCDDPSYINFMQASLFEEWLRILNEAKTKQNPNLIGTSQMEALPDHIKLFQEEQKRLNSKGFKALSIKDISSISNCTTLGKIPIGGNQSGKEVQTNESGRERIHKHTVSQRGKPQKHWERAGA